MLAAENHIADMQIMKQSIHQWRKCMNEMRELDNISYGLGVSHVYARDRQLSC